MELNLESGLVIPDATEEDIRNHVENEDFAVLGAGDNTYIQCAISHDPSSEYILEYQDGSLDRHYHAVDDPITLDRVVAAFIKYLHGDSSWQWDFRWEKLEL